MGIFLIILILIFLFWPWIVKWFRGFMARRAEDALRRMMGMPSRKEERRRAQAAGRGDSGGRKSASRANAYSQHHESVSVAAVMRQYAEDVEYTEYHEYSSEEIIGEGVRVKTHREYHESQISDAEYVEIDSGNKK